MDIKSELKKVREKYNLTQEELADELGVSRQSIIALESGKYRPSIPVALLIAEFFELPVEYIFRCQPEEGEEIKSVKHLKKEGEITVDRDIMPWTPWREMMNMRDTIDRLFDDSLVSLPRPSELGYPAINIHQTAKEVIVEADVPGMKEEEIEIEVADNAIGLHGERKQMRELKKEDYYHREVSYGSFSRSVSLPAEVDAARADAKLEHGTLTITLPKKEPKAARTIKLKPRVGK